MNETAKEISITGEKDKNFDYEKGFEELIKKDDDGKWIASAGRFWKNFDYEKGFEALIKRDKVGEWIASAGRYWKNFNYEKGLEELIKKDKDGEYISLSGQVWPNFDYIKGLNELIKKDKDGKYIRDAEKEWEIFRNNKIFLYFFRNLREISKRRKKMFYFSKKNSEELVELKSLDKKLNACLEEKFKDGCLIGFVPEGYNIAYVLLSQDEDDSDKDVWKVLFYENAGEIEETITLDNVDSTSESIENEEGEYSIHKEIDVNGFEEVLKLTANFIKEKGEVE